MNDQIRVLKRPAQRRAEQQESGAVDAFKRQSTLAHELRRDLRFRTRPTLPSQVRERGTLRASVPFAELLNPELADMIGKSLLSHTAHCTPQIVASIKGGESDSRGARKATTRRRKPRTVDSRRMGTKKQNKNLDTIAVEMGLRLKKDREAHKLSQPELAKRITEQGFKLVYTALGNYERGRRRIPHEVAFALEKIFGKPAGYYLIVLSLEEQAVIGAMRKARQKD